MEHDLTNGEWTFTFQWRIENFSHCLQKKGEILHSPLFAVEALENSEWNLCLYPRGRDSGSEENFGLRLRRGEVGPSSLLVEYELSIFTSDSSEPVIEYTMSFSFLKKFSGPFHGLPKQNERSLANENTFLEQEVLIVRCRLRPFNPKRSVCESMLLDSAMQCSAVSRIEVDRGYCYFIIKSFSRLGMKDIETTRLITRPKSRESFTMQAFLQGRSEENSSVCLQIIQDVNKSKRLLLFCKVSLLDAYGRGARVVEDKHWFEMSSGIQALTLGNIITRRELLRSSYFLGNVLSLKCEFSLSSGVEFEKIDKPCTVWSLYKEQTLTDFELGTETASFPVHKVILSARSPVFKAMFNSNMKESSTNFLHIPDLDAETLGGIISFIYTSTIDPLNWDRAVKLYYAADKYQILSLKRMCATFLKRNLRFPNVCEALVIADRHQDEELKSDVHGFLLQYMKKFILLDEWKTFMVQHVELAAETMHLILLKRNMVDKKSVRFSI